MLPLLCPVRRKENTQSSHKAIEYFVLMELCTVSHSSKAPEQQSGEATVSVPVSMLHFCRSPHSSTSAYHVTIVRQGGSLIDLIRRRNGRKLGELQICELFVQICRGVQHMHNQSPPIAHRDIKIENVLIDARGTLKLCDFGSATTRAKAYTTSKEIVEEEELIGKYSTAMYRAPEMSDLYRRLLVNEKVDVWALGCTLFTLAFFTQPFQDGGNLQILSGSYDVPEGHGFSNYLTALIKRLLTVDPAKRPDIGQVLALCAQWHRWLKGGGVAKPAAAAGAPTRATSGGAGDASVASGPATAVTEPTQMQRHRSADEAGSNRASAPLEPQSAKPAKKSSKIPKEKNVRSVAALKEDADDSWADFGGFTAAAPASAPAATAAPKRSVSASAVAAATAADSSSDCSSTDEEEDDAQPRGRPRAPSSYAKPASKAKTARSSPPAAAPAAGASRAAASASLSPKTAVLFDFDFAPASVPAHPASASPAADDDDWAAFDSAAPPARQQQQHQFQSSPSPAPAVAAFDFDFSGLSPPPPSATAAAAASPSSAHGRRSKQDDTIDIGRLSIRGHTHS